MTLLVSLVVVGLLSVSTTTSTTIPAEEEQLLLLTQQFHTWVGEHGKEYNNEEERARRLTTWIDNDKRIREHNDNPTNTYTLGHNEYSDMTEDEFAMHFKLGKYAKKYNNNGGEDNIDKTQVKTARRSRNLMEDTSDNYVGLPDYVNWVNVGAVTPIKNQGACGSCWAFSTTGALEGAKFVKTGELVSLSEQNLLDCDHTDMGCSGGLMDNAFKFDEKSGGLCSEKDYPYKARQGKCVQTNCTDVTGSEVHTFVDVPPGKEMALVSAIAMQPISVAIQAGQFSFQFYKNGVLTDNACGSHGEVDHGVLAVGYGTDLETQESYFLVKNSWGETWGENGFVKIGRKSKNDYGICSILKMASFPITE